MAALGVCTLAVCYFQSEVTVRQLLPKLEETHASMLSSFSASSPSYPISLLARAVHDTHTEKE